MDNKTFIDKLAADSGIDKSKCISLLEEFTETLGTILEEDTSVSIPSFGIFELRKRKERILSHPSDSSKRLLIPPKLVMSFKPSNILKNKINNIDYDEQ